MSRSDLANPLLHAALGRAFGPVSVAGRGEQPRRDPSRRSGVTGGEFYRVACPYCHETRHRLYVSALYNTPRLDENGLTPMVSDRPDLYGTDVVVCYNAGCLHSTPQAEDERELFRRRLQKAYGTTTGMTLSRVRLAPALPPRTETTMPDGVIPLKALGPRHFAARYLAGRGFDAAFLSDYYGVGYCPLAPPEVPMLADRIVVPIWQEGRLASWQARLVDERFSVGMKYYNERGGIGKSRLLYNLDRISLAPFAVLVEGITDVWRLGDRACSPFGKVVSDSQVALLVRRLPLTHPGAILAVMLDPDAEHESRSTAGLLSSRFAECGGRVVEVRCLPGADPADLGYVESWRLIRSACMAAGIPNLPIDP